MFGELVPCAVILFILSSSIKKLSFLDWQRFQDQTGIYIYIDLNIIGWKLIIFLNMYRVHVQLKDIRLDKVTVVSLRMNHRKTHPHPNFYIAFYRIFPVSPVSPWKENKIDIDIFMWNWLWTQDQDSSDIQVPFRFHFARKALLQSDDHWKCLRWPHMTSTERVQPWCA